MSTLTISSPGVQINEVDLSILSRPLGSTDVLVTGFAPQGPTEELVNVGSVSEFESVFGTPTNASERYLYYTARQILSQSPANLYVTRFPYGAGLGDGYSNSYSALVYPISSNADITNVNGVTAFYTNNGAVGYQSTPTVVLAGGNLDNTDVQDSAIIQTVIYDYTNYGNPSLSSLVGTISGYNIISSGTGYSKAPSATLVGGGPDLTILNNLSSLYADLSAINFVYGQAGLSAVDNIDAFANDLIGLPPVDAIAASLSTLWVYANQQPSGASFVTTFQQHVAVLNQQSGPYDLTGAFSDLDGLYQTYIYNSPTFVAEQVTSLPIGVVGTTENTYTESNQYSLGAPVSILLSDDDYQDIISNNINWSNQYNPNATFNIAEDLKNAGLIVINEAKIANDDLYEGYYVALADNSNVNIATDFNYIKSIQAVHGIDMDYSTVQDYVSIPQSRLEFSLTQTASSYGVDSISKVVEQFPLNFNFSTPSYIDSLILVVFKLKATQYSQDTVTLNYSIVEGYAGSLNSRRTQNNPNGGQKLSFFLDTVVNTKSNNIKVITNPYITSTGTWTLSSGLPAKSVKLQEESKSAWGLGVYTTKANELNGSELGQVDQKLSRFLTKLSNDDTTNIDLVVDGGLSTIWATANSQAVETGNPGYTFDETYTPSDIDNSQGLANTDPNVIPSGETIYGWNAITDQFVAYAESRKNHIFVSDSLRQIFVRGDNGIISKRKSYSFALETYWPLNNLYSEIASSYVTTYGNWIQTNDVWTSKPVWVPSSGYAAAAIAQSSQTTYPWIAPAGFNRGRLVNVLNLGVNPTQKQRDSLYKININPIAYFNTDGFVIMGQKTMYRQPSAFDRINVRRLFLTLEKEAQKLLKFYVFEPNDFATRNRLKASLTPIFDQAKLNDGCYDYLIVCDTTNNTPAVIDSNELKISIYIQPVRAAEFILADFIATTTGVNFSELIAGGQS